MVIEYPLEQVLHIKKDRVAKAEKVVKEKKRLYEIELERLEKMKKERDIVKAHYTAKVQQLRDALDAGTTSEDVLKMKAYIKVVSNRVLEEEDKVSKQSEVIRKAQDALKKAQEDLKRRQMEEEKTRLHKAQWMKEALLQEMREEEKEQDEIGQLLFGLRSAKKKKGM